jgi:hypothetical protein
VPLPPKLREKVDAPAPALPEPLAPAAPQVTPEPPAHADRQNKPGHQCKVCQHDWRAKIEAHYADNRGARWIADWLLRASVENSKILHVKERTILAHFDKCVKGAVMKSESSTRSADAFLGKLEGLSDRIEGYLKQFDESGHVCGKCREPDEEAPKPREKDFRSAAALLREARSILELWGKTLGHVRPDTVINIIENPQFLAVVNPICEVTAACSRCGPMVAGLLGEGE